MKKLHKNNQSSKYLVIFGVIFIFIFSMNILNKNIILRDFKNSNIELNDSKSTSIQSPLTPSASSGTLVDEWTFDYGLENTFSGKPNVTLYGGSGWSNTSGVDGKGYITIYGPNSYAEILYDTSFDIFPITVEFWFQSIEEYNETQRILYKTNQDGYYTYKITRNPWDTYNTGQVILQTQDTAGTFYQSSNPNDLSLNEWHMVTFYVDQYQIGYYLDGKYVHSTSVGGSGNSFGNGSIILGDPLEDVEVRIDNLRIYNGILNDSEILERYALYRPVANFEINPESQGYTTDTIIFNATSTFGGTAPYKFIWDFGDGTIIDNGEEPVINYTYQKSGYYIVTLNVTDNDGFGSTAKKYFNVEDKPVVNDDEYEENDDWHNASQLDPIYMTQYSLTLCDDDYFHVLVPNDNSLTIKITSENITNINIDDIDPNDGSVLRTVYGINQSYGDSLTLSFSVSGAPENYLIHIWSFEYSCASYNLELILNGDNNNSSTDDTNNNDISNSGTDTSSSGSSNDSSNTTIQLDNPFGSVDGFSINYLVFSMVSVSLLIIIKKRKESIE